VRSASHASHGAPPSRAPSCRRNSSGSPRSGSALPSNSAGRDCEPTGTSTSTPGAFEFLFPFPLVLRGVGGLSLLFSFTGAREAAPIVARGSPEASCGAASKGAREVARVVADSCASRPGRSRFAVGLMTCRCCGRLPTTSYSTKPRRRSLASRRPVVERATCQPSSPAIVSTVVLSSPVRKSVVKATSSARSRSSAESSRRCQAAQRSRLI
jgi:hypothetical protein